MKKPWSITTTLRDPERLRNFLIVLNQIENSEWSFENQKKYQILLIQNRVYAYGKPQFYNGLSQDQINLVDDQFQDISFEQAEGIFHAKNYEDPAMRGRQSINPLKKIGLVAIDDGKVKITELGKLFLKDDFDFGEIFFRSFLKWQLPNPDSRDYPDNGDYDIKPFIGTLHLIKEVNLRWEALGNDPVGLSKKEFLLFSPTLVNFANVGDQAQKVIDLRSFQQGKSKRDQKEIFDKYQQSFAEEFLGTDSTEKIRKLLNNLRDYGDNAIRYFRLTKLIFTRGNGHYVDLEPRRSIGIDALLNFDNAQSKSFDSKEKYLAYISDISEPQLPWETIEKYIEIIKKLVEEIEV